MVAKFWSIYMKCVLRVMIFHLRKSSTSSRNVYRVAPKKRNSRCSGLCSDQQLSFFTLLDRASFHHYNNTKIIKFG